MASLPGPLAGDLSPLTSDLDASVLTPADVGMRFYGEFAEPGARLQVYPVARWIDQSGTRWEHRRGQVQIQDGSPGGLAGPGTPPAN